MLLSFRLGGEGGGARAGRPSDPRSRGCECIYIALSQPAVSDFRLCFIGEFSGFSVNAVAERKLTPEPSWKAEVGFPGPLLVSFLLKGGASLGSGCC